MDRPRFLKDLCTKILEFDKNIRFAGIVDKFGKTVIAEHRKGSVSLLAEEESVLAVIKSTIILGTGQTLQPMLGKISYIFAVYEKVKLATIPLIDGSVLLMSFDKEAEHDSLITKKILPLAKKLDLRRD